MVQLLILRYVSLDFESLFSTADLKGSPILLLTIIWLIGLYVVQFRGNHALGWFEITSPITYSLNCAPLSPIIITN